MSIEQRIRAWGPELVTGFLLILATVSVYAQIYRHEFINFDDNLYVLDNPYINQGLSFESMIWAFTTPHVYNWHPLTSISHMIDCSLFGLDAGAHHLMNLAIHLVNTALLFWILRVSTGRFLPTVFVAALFALHPLHVESVAWASERKDTLSAFFGFVTILTYIRYSAKPSIKRYVLVFVPFILGLMSKQMLVTWPFVLLLLDYWPLQRIGTNGGAAPQLSKSPSISLTHSVVEKIPFLFISIVASVVVYMVQSESGMTQSSEYAGFASRVQNSFVSYVTYLSQTVWPANLAVFYPHPGDSIPIWKTLASITFLATVSATVILLRKRRYYLMGWLWYLGTLVPVIGLVQVGLQAHADRYTYLPLIGLFIMLAFALDDAFKRARLTCSVSMLVVIGILLPVTWIQVGYWRSSDTIFRHALNSTQNNYWAHNALGFTLYREGYFETAEVHFRNAVTIRPSYADARFNLAVIMESTNRPMEAIEVYLETIRYNANHRGANYNIANLLIRKGSPQDAVSYYETVLSIDPGHSGAHVGLGVASNQLGRREDALYHFREAYRIDPDNEQALNNLSLLEGQE
ncbi:MAG: tetratricopeptide repeat protein [Candidatus Hydrogenedentota bacterium]